MFNWNDLRYFLELARQRRVGPAAKRLNVDHSTVGRRIAELEKVLDTKLFDRTQSGFVPTDAGRRLLSYAEAIERNAHAVIENAGDRPPLAGRVRLVTMEGLASFYLAPRLVEFNQRFPSILVELIISTQLVSLTKREADISLGFVAPTSPRLLITKVGQVDIRLYGAPSYLEAHGVPERPADLKNHLFLDYVEDEVRIGEVRWLLDVIEEPNVVFRSTSLIAQQNAAAAGMGLVMLPSFLGAGDKRLVPLLVNKQSVSRGIWLGVHEDLRYIARVKAVVDFIKGVFKRDRRSLAGREF
jgi:DNA-binding transcriptional LysR family regulator